MSSEAVRDAAAGAAGATRALYSQEFAGASLDAGGPLALGWWLTALAARGALGGPQARPSGPRDADKRSQSPFRPVLTEQGADRKDGKPLAIGRQKCGHSLQRGRVDAEQGHREAPFWDPGAGHTGGFHQNRHSPAQTSGPSPGRANLSCARALLEAQGGQPERWNPQGPVLGVRPPLRASPPGAPARSGQGRGKGTILKHAEMPCPRSASGGDRVQPAVAVSEPRWPSRPVPGGREGLGSAVRSAQGAASAHSPPPPAPRVSRLRVEIPCPQFPWGRGGKQRW